MRNLSIKYKIMSVCLILLISFSAFAVLYILPTIENQITEKTIDKVKNIIETAHSVTETNYNQFRSGVLSEHEAKERSKDAIRSMLYGEDGYIWINDYNSVIVMHPVDENLNGKDMTDVEDPTGLNFVVEMVNIVLERGEGELNYYWNKPGFEDPVPKIAYVKGFDEWQWVIGTGVYTDDLAVTVNQVKNNILAFTGVLFIFAVILILIIVIPLNKNLKILLQYIQKVSSFDFTETIKINQKDEVGVIASSVSLMVEELRGLLLKIRNMESSLKESSTVIKDSLDELGLSSERVAATISELSGGASEQAASAEKGSVQINEIVQCLSVILNEVNDSENLTDNAMEVIGKGDSIVKYQIEKMEENHNAVKSVDRAITQLKDRSQKIGQILETINAIASQTNLLALNASIEAARAGEAGKGFAVVANEVRKLAEQSEESVTEIGQLVKDIQIGVADVSAEMQNSDKIVAEQEKAVEGTVKAFYDISEKVTQIANNIKSVVEATKELNTNAVKANDSIMEISSISQETAAGTEEVAATSEEQTSIVFQIANKTHELADYAEQLNESVNKFTI